MYITHSARTKCVVLFFAKERKDEEEEEEDEEEECCEKSIVRISPWACLACVGPC